MFKKLLCSLFVALTSAGGCDRSVTADNAAEILLFTGDGASKGDVAALKKTLSDAGFSYDTINSRRLNAMSASQLRAYRLLIIPGGNFETIGKGLSHATTANIRSAVRGGLNYLGVCAGAFFAGASPYNGLDLTEGVAFPFYSAEARGVHRAAVTIEAAGEPARDHYWEDGPALIGWGEVVGKYPDGTAAIVQGRVADGWVVLTGVHPEAPARWRGNMQFRTLAAEDNAYAAGLVRAALNGAPLAHF